MNPTQEPDDTDATTNPLVELLSDPVRFRSWIAQAGKTAADRSPVTSEQPEHGDCYSLTAAGYRAVEDPFEMARLLPDVVTKPGGHHPECCCLTCDDAYVADSYGEHLTDRYLTEHEVADAREVLDDGDEPGSVPDVLRSAARYLELHGWIQGAYFDATAGVFTPAACVVGAIAMVCYGGPVDAPAQMFDQPGFAEFEAAVLHLDRYLLVEDGSEAYAFNDARGRTADDVIHALRQAAATPEHELIDALKAIDEADEWLASSGLTAEQVAALLKGGDAQ